jgi:hypothetical protein
MVAWVTLPHHGLGGKVGPCETRGAATAANPEAAIQTMTAAHTAKRTNRLFENTLIVLLLCSEFPP